MVVGEAALDAMFAPVPATLQILIYTSSGHEALQKKHRTLGQVHGPVRPFEMAQLHGRNNIPRVQLLVSCLPWFPQTRETTRVQIRARMGHTLSPAMPANTGVEVAVKSVNTVRA